MNRSTKVNIILILPFWLVVDQMAFAQKIVINSRDEFSVAVSYCLPTGSKITDGEPALLANMKPAMSIEGRYLTSLPKKLQIGLTGSYTMFEGWAYPNNLWLKNASVSFLSIGPTLAYRTWSSTKSFQNKLNFYGAVTSGVSNIEVLTTADSEVNSDDKTDLLEVSSTRLFIQAEAGAYYNISHSLALVASVGYRHTGSDSQVFTDKSYSFLSLRLGVVARLFNDKRYKFLN